MITLLRRLKLVTKTGQFLSDTKKYVSTVPYVVSLFQVPASTSLFCYHLGTSHNVTETC